MRTMGNELDDNLKIVREHGASTTVTSEYMNGWDRPSENEDWSHHNMYLTALRRIIKLEDNLEEIDGYLGYERHDNMKLKEELKECYDLHEVALEMVENE